MNPGSIEGNFQGEIKLFIVLMEELFKIPSVDFPLENFNVIRACFLKKVKIFD